MAQLSGFSPVLDLMNHIAESGAKYPKVRLDLDGQPLVLTIAGARAKQPGSINLTDGGRYPDNKFFGRITFDGDFEPSKMARSLHVTHKRALWNTLTRMRDGEAEQVFAENGKRLGTCCLCGRPLSDQESVELGIGPVCREKAFG